MKRLAHFVTRRSPFITAILTIAIAIIIVWYVITGFSRSDSAIAIGIAALSALFAAFGAFATLMQAAEMQHQRENEERPYIVAHFEPTSSGMVYFTIQNIGKSPALDVTVTIEPSPVTHSGKTLSELSLLKNPIRFLMQGTALRHALGPGYFLLEKDKPTNFEITILYRSIKNDSFSETQKIDLEHLREAVLPPRSIEDQLGKLTEEVDKLVKLFDRVIRIDSFMVESPDQYRERMENYPHERKQESKEDGTE